MKLLRDFIRMRIGGRRPPRIGLAASDRPWTITVPRPLIEKTPQASIDMHWRADA